VLVIVDERAHGDPHAGERRGREGLPRYIVAQALPAQPFGHMICVPPYWHIPPTQLPGLVNTVSTPTVPMAWHVWAGGLVQSMDVVHAPGAAAQIPPVHVLLTQSVPVKHFMPVAHAGHIPPPQSVSVSLPSLMPSLQVFVVAEQTPAVQKPLQQLALVMHAPPLGEHICMGEHTPPLQIPLQQGAFIAQA
jgi:hypothetical protein